MKNFFCSLVILCAVLFASWTNAISGSFQYINGTDINNFSSLQKARWDVYIKYIAPEVILFRELKINRIDTTVTKWQKIELMRNGIEQLGLLSTVYEWSELDDPVSLIKTGISKALGESQHLKYVQPIFDIGVNMLVCAAKAEAGSIDLDACLGVVVDSTMNVVGAYSLWEFYQLEDVYRQLDAISIAEAFVHKVIKENVCLLVTPSTIRNIAAQLSLIGDNDYDEDLALTLANNYHIYLDRLAQNNPPELKLTNIQPSIVFTNQSPVNVTFHGVGFNEDIQILWKELGTKGWKTLSQSPDVTSDSFTVQLYLGENRDKTWEFKLFNHELYQESNIVRLNIRRSTVSNEPPDTPTVFLQGGNVNTTLTPTINTSAFNDPNIEDSHDGTWWEIRQDGTLIWTTNWDSTNLTSIIIPPNVLLHGTTYSVNVRHRDDHHEFSTGYGTTSFVTAAQTSLVTLEYISYDIEDDTTGESHGNNDGKMDSGETIELDIKLHNTGNADAHNVSAILSTSDSCISVNDSHELWGRIDSGNKKWNDHDYDFSVSSSCQNGHQIQFYLSITSDEGSWNHSFFIPVYNSGLPDLVLLNPSVNNTVPIVGDSIQFSVDVKNQGTAHSDSTYTRYYISGDPTITTDDTEVENESTFDLIPNGTDYESISFNVPTIADTYWIGACVDIVNNETDITNNCSSSIQINVKNFSQMKGDINSDDSVSISDAILGLQIITKSFSSSTVSLGSDVNQDGKIGMEEVIYVLQKISQPPAPINDITISNTSLSDSSVSAGDSITVNCRQNYTGNQTDAQLNNPNVGYYLSINTTWDDADVYLDNDSSSIGSDDPYDSESQSVIIPSGTASGNYYILFIADYLDEIEEASSESNNISYLSIYIEAPSPVNDITISNASLSDSNVSAGDSITVSCRQNYTGNQTDAQLNNPNVGYYLSTNTTWDGADVYLDNDSSSIGSDDPYDSESQNVTIPPGTASGDYYILFVADYLDEIDEGVQENNNVAYRAIFIASQEISVTPTDGCAAAPDITTGITYSVTNLNTSSFGQANPIDGRSSGGGLVRGFYLKLNVPADHNYAITISDVSSNFDPVFGLKYDCSSGYVVNPANSQHYADSGGDGDNEEFRVYLLDNHDIGIRIYHYNGGEVPIVSFKLRVEPY